MMKGLGDEHVGGTGPRRSCGAGIESNHCNAFSARMDRIYRQCQVVGARFSRFIARGKKKFIPTCPARRRASECSRVVQVGLGSPNAVCSPVDPSEIPG